MSNQSRLQELDALLRKMRLEDRDADLTGLLRSEVLESNDQEEKVYIYSLLAKELQSHSRLLEAEAAIRASIEIQPEIPDSWITLALHHFYYTHQLEDALSAINTAVEKSHLEGNFVRQSLLERIRIALELERYFLVEESLMALLLYEPAHGSLDVDLEGEFLSRIPPGTVNASVIERYKRSLLKRAT
jgi:hypothetical protein